MPGLKDFGRRASEEKIRLMPRQAIRYMQIMFCNSDLTVRLHFGRVAINNTNELNCVRLTSFNYFSLLLTWPMTISVNIQFFNNIWDQC